jgi:carboxyl-terminal processing protease
MALALAFGIIIGTMMSGRSDHNTVNQQYRKFAEILGYVKNDYVDTVNIDDLVDYSITKMLEKLDPHTSYIPKKDIEIARAQLEGDFEGIGIEFNIIKDTIYVVAPISGGPSEAAGLMAGDKIIMVDGKNMAGKEISNADVFGKLRGKKGTQVKISVLRKGTPKPFDFIIIRDKIPTFSVDVSYMIDPTSGYIKISRFAANTYTEFKEALTGLKAKGMKRLILDLRDNPGGYLDKATKIADEFIDDHKLIVYTDGKGKRFDSRTEAYEEGDFETGPVIVLINEGSASASEIVSGALQDNDRALIVGRRSFGKGLVQMPVNLSDSSELRLTISRYYTPSGRSIQKHYDSENADDYNADLINRYKHGEYFHADSIRFVDSLKYKTLNGRIVYGGGGIMPDIFVPRDTSAYTNYLVELFNKNIIREYTLNYFSEHKNKLQNIPFESFYKDFDVSDKMLEDIVQLATAAGIKYKNSEFNTSKEFLKLNLKAYIARSIYGPTGFYPLLNQGDEIYLQALKLFGKAEQLEKGGKANKK